eukprot:SAG22_NODE_3325_length_1777_cov_8.503576_1_plen_208_part_00
MQEAAEKAKALESQLSEFESAWAAQDDAREGGPNFKSKASIVVTHFPTQRKFPLLDKVSAAAAEDVKHEMEGDHVGGRFRTVLERQDEPEVRLFSAILREQDELDGGGGGSGGGDEAETTEEKLSRRAQRVAAAAMAMSVRIKTLVNYLQNASAVSDAAISWPELYKIYVIDWLRGLFNWLPSGVPASQPSPWCSYPPQTSVCTSAG